MKCIELERPELTPVVSTEATEQNGEKTVAVLCQIRAPSHAKPVNDAEVSIYLNVS